MDNEFKIKLESVEEDEEEERHKQQHQFEVMEEEEEEDQDETGGCHREPELVWTPDTIAALDQEDLDLYFQLTGSPCIPGGACNIELALEVLQRTRGDLKEAIQQMLKIDLKQRNIWTLDEVQAFERLEKLHKKNFFLISKDLKTKTVKQCVEFFYLWKKSTFRNRYLSPTTPKSTRSMTSSCSSLTNSSTTTTNTTETCPASLTENNLTGTPSSSASDESRDSGRGDSLLGIDEHKQYQLLISPNQKQQQEEFPCKVCGRVFEKIKSRSAHMKRHKNEGYRR